MPITSRVREAEVLVLLTGRGGGGVMYAVKVTPGVMIYISGSIKIISIVLKLLGRDEHTDTKTHTLRQQALNVILLNFSK
jgi:hypothetical protein